MSARRPEGLLTRPSPDDYGAELITDVHSVIVDQFVVVAFRIGREWLAFEAARVAEVGPARPVRRVPRRSGVVFQGLMNVRGQLEPCVSLAALLGLDTNAEADATRVLVLGASARRWAFRVHEVALRDVPKSAVAPLPATLTRNLEHPAHAITTLGDLRITWLDADRLGALLTMSLA